MLASMYLSFHKYDLFIIVVIIAMNVLIHICNINVKVCLYWINIDVLNNFIVGQKGLQAFLLFCPI